MIENHMVLPIHESESELIECDDCGYVFTRDERVLRYFGATSDYTCPDCGSTEISEHNPTAIDQTDEQRQWEIDNAGFDLQEIAAEQDDLTNTMIDITRSLKP